MWTIYARDDTAQLEAASGRIEAAWRASGAFSITARLDGATLDTYTADPNDRDTVHFGYRDSISQPRFVVNGDYVGRMDAQPIATRRRRPPRPRRRGRRPGGRGRALPHHVPRGQLADAGGRPRATGPSSSG